MPLAEPPAIEITYIGGPTALISIAGVTFITDPTFDESGRDYPMGKVSLHKLKGPAIPIDQIGKIDVALVSHDQHADNLDIAGRALLPKIPLVLSTKHSATKLGAHALGLDPWESKTITAPNGSSVRITATPARHGPAGIEPLAGEVIGFVISLDAKELVYVTGDTVWYDGTAEVARRYQPRVVLLFGGAASTRGPFHVTMNTNDAVEAAAAFRNATLVPVHHDGWAHFTQTQFDLQKTFDTLGIAERLKLVEPARPMRFQ
jgi:L-ascorbate metabolism protein UlaG (beta-lactamase superfamily)